MVSSSNLNIPYIRLVCNIGGAFAASMLQAQGVFAQKGMLEYETILELSTISLSSWLNGFLNTDRPTDLKTTSPVGKILMLFV